MPKTILDKVVDAVETLADPRGASRQAITKLVSERHGQVSSVLLKKALQNGVDKGRLVQTGQRFSLPGSHIQPNSGPAVSKTVVKKAKGDAPIASAGDLVEVSYAGRLESDGSQFDSAKSFKFTLGAGEVIKGWDIGVEGMAVGERATLVVPSKLGYGKRGAPPDIPGDSTLVFDVTLKRIIS